MGGSCKASGSDKISQLKHGRSGLIKFSGNGKTPPRILTTMRGALSMRATAICIQVNSGLP